MAGADDVDCSSFFDHIDDLLDIPDDTCNSESDFLFDDFKDFPSIWTQSDAFPESNSVFSENNSSNSASDDLSVPYEDIAQLEWLSTFVEDSFSAGNSLTIDVPSSVTGTVVSPPSPAQFQTTSPVSVLESSNSSYVKPAAAPSTFNRRLISPSASFTVTAQSLEGGKAECESVGELCNSSKIRKFAPSTQHKMKKNKKKKIKLAEEDQNDNPNSIVGAVRKCQHCEITKTPQWRAGPNGPKTLCNACGVRYKSGRLFPEYRPAASPTFVPSIHSNSHKKVIEMRVKTSKLTGSPLIEDSGTKK